MKSVILVLIVIFINTTFGNQDLLENIRVSQADEPEVNNFLRSVLRHKDDFRWIRNSRDRLRLQELTKNVDADEIDDEPISNDETNQGNIFFNTKPKRRPEAPTQQQQAARQYRRPMNDVYPYMDYNEPRFKRSFEFAKDSEDPASLHDSSDTNVKVITRSDIGVQDAPGIKIQRNSRNARECLGEPATSHSYIPLKGDGKENTQDNSSILGEFYYSSHHDLLGMVQDDKCEAAKERNETCIKTKRNLLSDLKKKRKNIETRAVDDRAIKVNIVDKGKLIKTVEQNENSNALVLTFKDESPEEKAANKDLVGDLSQPAPVVGTLNTSYPYISPSAVLPNVKTVYRDSLEEPRLSAFRAAEINNATDDTLENIDKILRHDQDSLKNSSYLPAYLKVKKASKDDDEDVPNVHKKETRMIKQGDYLNDDNNVLMVRNRPHNIIQQNSRPAVNDLSEPDRFAEYNSGPAVDGDMEDGNYAYKPVIYKMRQNNGNQRYDNKLIRDKDFFGYAPMGQRAPDDKTSHKFKYRGPIIQEQMNPSNKRRTHHKNRGRSNSYSETKILPNGIEEVVTQDPPQNKKNMLEDETEPTSASEQRELEKKDNQNQKFGTPSMDMSYTTEKMMIIPLKKSPRPYGEDYIKSEERSNSADYRDNYGDLIDLGEKSDADDKTFRVKSSKDMIHTKYKKSNQYDDIEAFSNELKSSELESNIDEKKLPAKRLSHSNNLEPSFNEKVRKSINSDADEIDQVNVNGKSLKNDDEYVQSLQNAKFLDSNLQMDIFRKRSILSVEEHKENLDLLRPIDNELDYQNGYSNEVNIRVKRTDNYLEDKKHTSGLVKGFDFGDFNEKSSDGDEAVDYADLGPQLLYETKHAIKQKDTAKLEEPVEGAEDTMRFGDGIPTCVNKRMDQMEEQLEDGNDKDKDKEEDAYDKKAADERVRTIKIKTNKDKPAKTDKKHDENVENEENPGQDIVQTKIKEKYTEKEAVETEDKLKEFEKIANIDEVSERPKTTPKKAHKKLKAEKKLDEYDSNDKLQIATTNMSLKSSEDRKNSDDDDDNTDQMKTSKKTKVKGLHKKLHHPIVDENSDIRDQLIDGTKKHKHKHRGGATKFKNEHHNPDNEDITKTNVLRNANTSESDLQDRLSRHFGMDTKDEEEGEELLNSPCMKQQLEQQKIDEQKRLEEQQQLKDEDAQGYGPNQPCSEDTRNELQIIEKDQAIILKFTPQNTQQTTYPDPEKLDSSDISGDDDQSPEDKSPSDSTSCISGESDLSNATPSENFAVQDKSSRDQDKLEKSANLAEETELFDKLLNIMTKYKKPPFIVQQLQRDQGHARYPQDLQQHQNKSSNSNYKTSNFDDDDYAMFSHHLHKDKRVHPPNSKKKVCGKIVKPEPEEDDRFDLLSLINAVDDKHKKTLVGSGKAVQILNENNDRTSYNNDLDSVDSFSDVVEIQNKGKRSKKQLVDEDLLPSDFINLTQVEEVDKPSIRKKRYLKFLYKDDSANEATTKQFRRTTAGRPQKSRREDYHHIKKRLLGRYDPFVNYDYEPLEFNYGPKYSRELAQNAIESKNAYNTRPLYNNHNSRNIQSSRNMQSIQSMRNRLLLDSAKKLNAHKYYRNISSNDPNNKTLSTKKPVIKATAIKRSKSSTKSPLTNSSASANQKVHPAAVRTHHSDHMGDIMNGKLILSIINQFTQKLKSNEPVYKRFGKKIPKKRAELMVQKIADYRSEETRKDIKHAEVMLHQVIIMLNRVVMDQVHRKICMTISPDLRRYLNTVTINTCKSKSSAAQIAEGYPLPELPGGNGSIPANQPPPPDDEQGDFLFEGDVGGKDSRYHSSNQALTSGESVAKKISLIKKLLKKYNKMSTSCQVKVEPVKTYLLDHLDMLEKIKTQEQTAIETTTIMDDSCVEENKFAANNPPGQINPPDSNLQNNDRFNPQKQYDNVYVGPNNNFPPNDNVQQYSNAPNIIQSANAELSTTEIPRPINSRNTARGNEIQNTQVDAKSNISPTRSAGSNTTATPPLEKELPAEEPEDARIIEAVKQKLVNNYGKGRFYPLSGRYPYPMNYAGNIGPSHIPYNDPYSYAVDKIPPNFAYENRRSYLPDIKINQMVQERLKEDEELPEDLPEQMELPKEAKAVNTNAEQALRGRDKRHVSVNSTSWHGSEKYQKLVEAAGDLRRKREIEERIGKLFGGGSHKVKKALGFNSNVQDVYPDLSKVQFETPIVYRVL